MRAYLHTCQFKVFHAAFQLLYGKLWVLHRHGSQAYKAFRVSGNYIGNMVVQKLGGLQGIVGFSPIVKHNRNGANHLNINLGALHIGKTALGAPAVFFNFSEKLVANHHFGVPLPVVF